MLGILAGNGRYPALLAEALRRAGAAVVAAGIKGETRADLLHHVDRFELFPLGAIERTVRFFCRHGAKTIYFAGGVVRHAALKYARPDLTALKVALTSLARGDDHLLREVAARFENLGLQVADPFPYLGALLAEAGHIAGPPPTDAALASLAVAWRGAKSLGGRDRGQAALALEEQVVALEDRLGTDALITKAPGPGAVLAKVVKPGQDRRFDLPAIGPVTIEGAKRSGLQAMGIEAQGVLLLEREKICDACFSLDISLTGFTPEGPQNSSG